MPFKPDNKYYYDAENFLNYKVVGHGATTLILLHGFGASLQTWSDILPLIPINTYRIILFDLKGAGFSSRPLSSDYSLSANADIVLKFIQERNIKNFVLIGHSFGGGVALLVTLRISENYYTEPKGMVLLSPAAYKSELPFFVKYIKTPFLGNLIVNLIPADRRARYTLEHIYSDVSKVTKEKVERYAFFLKQDGAAHALVQTAQQIVPRGFEKYTARYSDIDVPTLILWSKDDKALPISSGERLENNLRKAKLERLEGCGHNIQEECPNEVARKLKAFLHTLPN